VLSHYFFYRADDKDTGHIVVAYEAAGWTNPQHFTFLLLQSLLSYYDSANDSFIPGALSIHPSVKMMSKKHTLNSFVAFNGFTTIYKNTGLFGFYMKASADNLMTYVNELGCYINGLPYSLTQEYLDIAKRQLRVGSRNKALRN
jgi:mitochondrial-processing peptidase subunit beta